MISKAESARLDLFVTINKIQKMVASPKPDESLGHNGTQFVLYKSKNTPSNEHQVPPKNSNFAANAKGIYSEVSQHFSTNSTNENSEKNLDIFARNELLQQLSNYEFSDNNLGSGWKPNSSKISQLKLILANQKTPLNARRVLADLHAIIEVDTAISDPVEMNNLVPEYLLDKNSLKVIPYFYENLVALMAEYKHDGFLCFEKDPVTKANKLTYKLIEQIDQMDETQLIDTAKATQQILLNFYNNLCAYYTNNGQLSSDSAQVNPIMLAISEFHDNFICGLGNTPVHIATLAGSIFSLMMAMEQVTYDPATIGEDVKTFDVNKKGDPDKTQEFIDGIKNSEFTQFAQDILLGPTEQIYDDTIETICERPEFHNIVEKCKLTADEVAVLFLYTTNSYKLLNKVLRGIELSQAEKNQMEQWGDFDTCKKMCKQMAEVLTTAMEKLPPPFEEITYRGVNMRFVSPAMLKQYQALEPSTFTIEAPMSTSTNGVMNSFILEAHGKNTNNGLGLIIITLGKKFTSGRNLSVFSQHPNESEILFPPGTTFLILPLGSKEGDDAIERAQAANKMSPFAVAIPVIKEMPKNS
jgi:hypothetical protein